MQTLHTRINEDLYEFICYRKHDNPNKILIDKITKFEDGVGKEVEYSDLDPYVQEALRREVIRRFRE